MSAEEFERGSHSALRGIQTRLAKRSYKFPLAEGILKDKHKRRLQNKLPRSIVLADIESRIVQRALLQCLQPSSKSPLTKCLKTMVDINESEVNFGGTPGGGVPKALQKSIQSLNNGYCVFYKSDIEAFFTKVPHDVVLNFLTSETDDSEFVSVFENGLKVQLKNADEIKEYLNLFPDNEIGVPQGSALSALAGNIFLHNIDCKMKALKNIQFIRYIDDVIILAKSNDDLQKAKSFLKKELKKLSLALYDPAKDPQKAAEGHVRNGFEYLGCLIQRNQLEPGKATKEKLLQKVTNEILHGRSEIQKVIVNPRSVRKREMTFAKSLANIDELVRGWANSFRFVNNRRPLQQLDSAISKKVGAYVHWFQSLRFAEEDQRMRALGIFQTNDIELKKIEDY